MKEEERKNRIFKIFDRIYLKNKTQEIPLFFPEHIDSECGWLDAREQVLKREPKIMGRKTDKKQKELPHCDLES